MDELTFRNETEFFNHVMIYQDSMKPNEVGLVGNIVIIGYKLLEEQCPSCRQAMSQQLRVLYGNLPRYYQNHPEKKTKFFEILDKNVSKLNIFSSEKEIGSIVR